MSTTPIFKYPRTPHLTGSRLQTGDEDLRRIPYSEVKGRHLIVEEKVDGANCAISFGVDGSLLLQSRGHYLTGGYRERHYDLFKTWANAHKDALYSVLGRRYIVYGEWTYAKHTIFYDRLPHYFLEFDVFDKAKGVFLDTPSRRALLKPLPVCSVPLLAEGSFNRLEDILSLLGSSHYISDDSREAFKEACIASGVDFETTALETDFSGKMEGLYLKVEEGGTVVARLKYVRATYVQPPEGGTPWIDRPILPNRLVCPLETLFLPKLS